MATISSSAQPATTTTPATPASASPHERRPDVRAVFARAVAVGGAAIAGVRPDQFDDPTPCGDFDVRSLVGHLVTVLRRVARIGRGEDPTTDVEVLGVADDAWLGAWDDAADDVARTWSDDAVLARDLRLPWTTMKGSAALELYVNEVAVHTWDLATATGQRPTWDDTMLEVAFDAIQRQLPADGRAARFAAARAAMPPEARDFPAPFEAAVDVPADAPLLDRLVAWNGRPPSWRPAAGQLGPRG